MALPGPVLLKRLVGWFGVAVTDCVALASIAPLQEMVVPSTSLGWNGQIIVIVSVGIGLLVPRSSRPILGRTR